MTSVSSLSELCPGEEDSSIPAGSRWKAMMHTNASECTTQLLTGELGMCNLQSSSSCPFLSLDGCILPHLGSSKGCSFMLRRQSVEACGSNWSCNRVDRTSRMRDTYRSNKVKVTENCSSADVIRSYDASPAVAKHSCQILRSLHKCVCQPSLFNTWHLVQLLPDSYR